MMASKELGRRHKQKGNILIVLSQLIPVRCFHYQTTDFYFSKEIEKICQMSIDLLIGCVEVKFKKPSDEIYGVKCY